MRARWLWLLGRQEKLPPTTTSLARPQIARLRGHGVRTDVRSESTGTGATHTPILSGDSAPNASPVEHGNINASLPLALSAEDRRLLGLARLHGIYSMEDLLFQTDVGTRSSGRHGRQRLTETSLRRQDLDLWLFIMQYNKQRRGLMAIKRTWNALFRHSPVQVNLDPDNANARDIIDIAIYAGVTEDRSFLKMVCNHCIKYDLVVEGFWAAVVGALLHHAPSDAPKFANLLRRFYRSTEDLLLVLRSACESKAPEAFHQFLGIDRALRQRLARWDTWQRDVVLIYHEAIPYLWQLNRPADAFVLHGHLLAMGDLPRNVDVLLPFVGHLAVTDRPLEPFLAELERMGVDFSGELRQIHERERKAAHEDLFQAICTAGKNRRRISDEIVARALATSASAFDLILSPMRLIGNLDFGPLSVRQMVLTSPDFETLKARFDRLKELGIDTGVSKFTTIIRNLLTQRQFSMIKSLAASDMHHAEFADKKLQRQLLVHYEARGDVEGINRTLAILQDGRVDVDYHDESTSIFLEHAVATRDWQRVLDIIVAMHQTSSAVNTTALLRLRDDLTLPTSDDCDESDGIQRLVVPEFDQFAFFFALCQQLLATRTRFDPVYLRTALLRLAQQGRISLLHKQCRLLASYYSAPYRGTLLKQELAQIFRPAFQRLLVTWDFKYRQWRRQIWHRETALRPSHTALRGKEPWLAGARLLRMLRDKHGLAIDIVALRVEFVFRLRQLNYARGRYTVASNRKFAFMRGYTYRKMLEGWLQVWREEPVESQAKASEDSRETAVSSFERDDNDSKLDNDARPPALSSSPSSEEDEKWIAGVLAILRRETIRMQQGIVQRARRDGTPTGRAFPTPRPGSMARYLGSGARALGLRGGSVGYAASGYPANRVDVWVPTSEGSRGDSVGDGSGDHALGPETNSVGRFASGHPAKGVDIWAPTSKRGGGSSAYDSKGDV
jgi:hypothetical protein